MMYYKLYERRFGLLLAVCDSEICDKTLKSGEIEFYINPRFYKEKEGDKDKIIEMLRKSANYNLVGEEAVSCGIEAGVIDPDKIIRIENIPHAQGIFMSI